MRANEVRLARGEKSADREIATQEDVLHSLEEEKGFGPYVLSSMPTTSAEKAASKEKRGAIFDSVVEILVASVVGLGDTVYEKNEKEVSRQD